MKLVNEYIAEHDIKNCWIAGFVHPEMLAYVQPCHAMPSGLRILISRNVVDPVPPVIEGTVFLSSNELPPQGAGEYVPMTSVQPEALIGGNMLVYRGRFEVPLVAAMSHVHRSGALLRLGQVENAIAEAREAIEFFKDDPRPHLALGLALARAKQKDEARREFEMAARLSMDKPVFRNAEVRAQQELTKLE
jgi:hypothetical protein